MQISKRDQFPDWYDLKKYAGIESLNEEGWWSLLLRKLLFESIQLGNKYLAFTKKHRLTATTESYLKANGLMPELFALFESPLDAKFEPLEQLASDLCYVPTLSQLENYLVDIKAFVEKMRGKGPFEPYGAGDLPFMIHLMLPDHVILNQLEKQLPELRKRTALMREGARTRKYEIRNWVTYGLLPYIDLRLWEYLTGNRFTWKIISEAIFQPGEGSVEQTRKTVDQLAQELVFTGDGLSHLAKPNNST